MLSRQSRLDLYQTTNISNHIKLMAKEGQLLRKAYGKTVHSFSGAIPMKKLGVLKSEAIIIMY